MVDLKTQIKQLMEQNRRTQYQYQYTVPSPDSYPYQWLWDSCFHAIILSHFDLESAKKELQSLVAKQFPNGMIPHIIFWQKNPAGTHFHGELMKWGKADTSSLTQPPMLAYAVWRIYKKDHSVEFLKQMYQPIKEFYNYLLADRDPRAHHLAGIINPDESGEDNSPRFDQALDLPPQHDGEENFQKRIKLIEQNYRCNFDAPFCMKNFFWVKDVPFNVILVENLKVLSDIASELNQPEEADLYFTHSRLIVDAMRQMMLEDGSFWPIELNIETNQYQKIMVKTWHILAPLFGHIYTKKEAQVVIEKYLNNPDEFALPYLIPTVSISDPSFDPAGFWRGPVWININWFIYQGLKQYGFNSEAQKIAEATQKLIEKSGFREQFNPLTGEGQGAQNFTWGALVVDMEI